MVIGRSTAEVGPEDFTHPTYRGVWELVAGRRRGRWPGSGDAGWATRLRDGADDPAVSSAISELGVEPLLTSKAPDAAYVALHVVRLLELTAMRRIAERQVAAAAHQPGGERERRTTRCSASWLPWSRTGGPCANGSVGTS